MNDDIKKDIKKFGIDIIKCLDDNLLCGTGKLSFSFVNLIKKIFINRKPPLDWDGKEWPNFYRNENSLLWIKKNNKKIYLPQKILIGPWEAKEYFDKIHVKLKNQNFRPPYKNEKCLKFYIKEGDFNGENARLVSYDKNDKIMIFQGAYYFDWIMTNLALDFDRSPLPTLREETSISGKLQPLEDSPLANITGINGLLFSNDGYMIYQKRNTKVLVRPNQLCSGFSGTVDKIDIEHLVKLENPVLSKMDTAREAVEEIGIFRQHIKGIEFLGLTRELIRGGTPELFYAIDLNLSRDKILTLIPQHKEGFIFSVFFGPYAKSFNNSNNTLHERTLWQLMDRIEDKTRAPISIPFLTNLALWYWQWGNDQVGKGSLQYN